MLLQQANSMIQQSECCIRNLRHVNQKHKQVENKQKTDKIKTQNMKVEQPNTKSIDNSLQKSQISIKNQKQNLQNLQVIKYLKSQPLKKQSEQIIKSQSRTKIYKTEIVSGMKAFSDIKKHKVKNIFEQLKTIANKMGFTYQERLEKCLNSGTTKISLEQQLQKVTNQKLLIQDFSKKLIFQKYIQKLKQYFSTLNAQKQLKQQQTGFRLIDQYSLESINYANSTYFKDLPQQMILSGGAAVSITQGLNQQEKKKQKIITDLDFVGSVQAIKTLKQYAKKRPDRFMINFKRGKFLSGFYCIQQDKWVQLSIAFENNLMKRSYNKIGNLKIFSTQQLLKNYQYQTLQSKNHNNEDQMKSFHAKFAHFTIASIDYGVRKQKQKSDQQNINTIARINQDQIIQQKLHHQKDKKANQVPSKGQFLEE